MSSKNISHKYRLKYEDIIHNTERATLFLIRGSEFWLPNYSFKFLVNKYITVEEEILVAKKLIGYAKVYHYIPEKIEIKYDQEAIEELRFNSEECTK